MAFFEVGAMGAGGVGAAGFAQGGTDDVTQGDEHGGGVAGTEPAVILAEDDVANSVGAAAAPFPPWQPPRQLAFFALAIFRSLAQQAP